MAIQVAGDIPVSPITDWPADWTDETAFLRATRGWVDPHFFGFANQAAPKPDFALYYEPPIAPAPSITSATLLRAARRRTSWPA